MSARRWTLALALAILATATALCLSVLAGWQRGGTLPERVVWVATGVVLVVCAHLLPALIRGSPVALRLTGYLLWGSCMVTACYGHVVFFVFAQQHAGDARVSVTAAGSAETDPRPASTLTPVMEERAIVTHQLALAQVQRCSRDCAGLDVRRATLAAKLDALNAEADDIRRSEMKRDRVAMQRDALRADPVTSRLAPLLHVTIARVDLLSGVLFAAVLEGVACLLWTVALRPSPLPAAIVPVTDTPSPGVSAGEAMTGVPRPAVTSVAAAHDSGTSRHASRDAPLTPLPEPADDDVTRLVRDIAAGRLRPTVAGIRQHLGCSQAKASALRRQVIQPS